MEAKPIPGSPLFDLEQIGVFGMALAVIYLVGGFILFYLTFTDRHGRSRWPLHALMSLGVVSIGTGLLKAGLAASRLLAKRSLSGGTESPVTMADFPEVMLGPVWFGLIGLILGLLAGFRAILGMIREPGPRF